MYVYKYVHVYFDIREGTAEQPMEGGDQILREVRHREGNGIHLIRQQEGDLIRKRKENNWAWERGRAEDHGGEGRMTAKYNDAYVRSCHAETHSFL